MGNTFVTPGELSLKLRSKLDLETYWSASVSHNLGHLLFISFYYAFS